jgi:hypothetical protein
VRSWAAAAAAPFKKQGHFMRVFIRFLLSAAALFAAPFSRAGDSVVVVNEVHYNPLNPALEYVEIHNQLWFNVDLSGWRFDGGITYAFPEGKVVPARGYLVVAKDPAALQAATGYAGALGPFTGSLANDGETLKLWNNNSALRTRPSPPPAPAAAELWSGDLQGDGSRGQDSAPATMAGAEGISGFGNYWNPIQMVSYNGTVTGTSTTPISFALKDSAGTAGAVSFKMIGTFCGFNAGPANNPLFADYLFLSSPALPSADDTITWRFEGLDKTKLYSLYLYGAVGRGIYMKVDVNGNGTTVDDAEISVPVNGASLLTGIKPTATGRIIGTAYTLTHGVEVNWSGFQLFLPPTGGPAPTPEIGAYNSSLEKRRLMDEFTYSDAGKWPAAPDGSGFTLAKIDPQGGGQPANWAWSLQVNGTPGAVNFPATAAWNATLPKVAFNEVGGAADVFWEGELYNYGASAVTLTGWQIINSDTAAAYTFPATTLAPGTYLALNETVLGFHPAENARLFLQTPTQLVDAVKVAGKSRARQIAGTGQWLRPNAPTIGAANTFALQTSVVINEIFHEPFDDGPEQWLEVKNRTGTAVDLTGWKFTAGVDYAFPAGTLLAPGECLAITNNSAALLLKYPGRRILGNYGGSLSSSDTLTLEDPNGNPADEVSYEEGGRWSELAAGGGASLELRDADADNSVPESWAPSATAPLGAWQTFSYTETATDDGIGLDNFKELIIGMLDSGEFLLDDVSVRENGTTEFMQNGNFQTDTVGSLPQKWRCIGTHGIHGRTVVALDPDNSANKVLRVVSTGNTDDKHNRLETTFAGGRQVTVGNSYTISFKARWVSGSNQVNTRLYFNYLQRTNLLSVDNHWGTPAMENSTAIANAGPTARDVRHTPAIPTASTPVPVSALFSDPEGVASAQVYYRVGTGGWQNVAMSLGADGRHSGSIPGQAAGSLVQFYLRATDGLGAVATWPAAADKGGVFYRVNDGQADTTGLRSTLRVLMAPENDALLSPNQFRMSNHLFPCTIIEDERIVYYHCAGGLKGSAAGRYGEGGLSLEFPPDQPFRGVHTSVSIERGNASEIVAKHLLNRAGGGYWSQYDDDARIIGIGPAGVGNCLIAPARMTSVFLKSLFPDESSGNLYNHELLYQPTSTVDGNLESPKLNNPYVHTRGFLGLQDFGTDKEKYRWQWQLKNRRKADDYSIIIRANQAIGSLSGAPLAAALDPIIDVDQWMRTWAMMGLYGNDDQIGRLWPHNFRVYQRPTDGRLLAFPWDLDRAFNLGANASLTPTVDVNGNFQNIQKLFDIPAYKRMFDSHVLDIVNTTFNSTYMTPWTSHYTAVTGIDQNRFASYIANRATYALSTLPPVVPFSITTNGGADFTTAANTTILEGNGWSDVYTITRSGQPTPLAVQWTGSTTWRVTLPLTAGANAITLLAYDQHGTATGTDTITITSDTTNVAANAANLVISEIHYHPAEPSVSEHNAGYTDADDFQFIELHNISGTAVELAGCSFGQGLKHDFTASTILAPGGVLVLARNPAAFQFRYGFPAGTDFTGRLSHADETVTLLSAISLPIKSFRYEDQPPWPVSADGDGYSLILRRPVKNPDVTAPINWSSSAAIGGSPGVVESVTFAGWLAGYPGLGSSGPLEDPDHDGLSNAVEYGLRTNPLLSGTGAPFAAVEALAVDSISANYFVYRFRRHIGVTDAVWTPHFSATLNPWNPVDMIHVGSVNNGDGTETVTYRSTTPATGTGFSTLQITLE